MAELSDLGPQLIRLLDEQQKNCKAHRLNRKYKHGQAPIPKSVCDAKLTKAYKALMDQAQAPWGGLVVVSALDRLEVGGIRFGDKALEQRLWAETWQANALDAMSKLAHDSALTDGRAFATVWRQRGEDSPEIVFDSAETMVVSYREGRHQPRHRTAALRRWTDEESGKEHLTLYTAAFVYKLREAKEQSESGPSMRVKGGEKWWEPRYDDGEDNWPLENPWGVVPVVELATNRELRPGAFSYACGEFEHCHGLLDRINLLTFLGLVVAVWMGFPLRYAIGDRILRDDDNEPIPPFEARPDSVAQLEDPNATIGQLEAADRKNLSVLDELAQLAYVTKTPAHYFPMANGISNISADAIRALEGGLHAKVNGVHKPFIGEGHEEVLRVAGLMLDKPIEVPPIAEVLWVPRESRSFAESVDGASKLVAAGAPLMFVAEEHLGYTQEAIRRLEAAAAGNAITRLLDEAANPTNGTAPAPEGEEAAA
jgi:hypothetical protein